MDSGLRPSLSRVSRIVRRRTLWCRCSVIGIARPLSYRPNLIDAKAARDDRENDNFDKAIVLAIHVDSIPLISPDFKLPTAASAPYCVRNRARG